MRLPYRPTLQRASRVLRVLATHLPLIVLLTSISVNVLLAAALSKERQRGEKGLQIGTSVASIEGTSPSGAPLRISYDESTPTVLYHFSPTCGWCERNWDNVRAAIEQTRGRFRFVGITTSELPMGFLRSRKISFDAVTNVGPEVVREYHFGGTPSTVIVAPGGKILQVWAGAYTGPQSRVVETILGVRLPGLKELLRRP